MKKTGYAGDTLLIVCAFMTFLGVTGCGKSSDSSRPGSTIFFNAAKKVAPNIETSTDALPKSGAAFPSLSRASASTYDWASGNVTYELYTILRDYEYPRDEGVIDMQNIFKVIHEVDSIYGQAVMDCTTIPEQIIEAPFDLGSSFSYNCAGHDTSNEPSYGRSFAIREDGDDKYALLAYKWAPDPSDQTSLGVMQGKLNEVTGDLILNMAHLVDYGLRTDDFSIRNYIEGNTDTNTFRLQLIKKSIGDGTSLYYWISVVGAGISEGEGNYFLFKVRSGYGDTPQVTDKYYCFPASAGESTLQALTNAGSDTVDENCSAYQDDVDAMTFLTTSDAPTTAGSFTNSSIYLSF